MSLPYVNFVLLTSGTLSLFLFDVGQYSLEKKDFFWDPSINQESNRTTGITSSETVLSSCISPNQEQIDPVLLPLFPNWRVRGVNRADPLQHS